MSWTMYSTVASLPDGHGDIKQTARRVGWAESVQSYRECHPERVAAQWASWCVAEVRSRLPRLAPACAIALASFIELLFFLGHLA